MITTSTITSVKNADKALFFMTKKGCSNCEKVKPMIEKFESENPDVLVFTHEAESPTDEMLKEFPPIKMFPGIFCLKSGKIVSVTNAIPPYESFTIGLLPIGDKYAHFGKVTRQLAQMEADIKNAKEFHQFLDQSITMEEANIDTQIGELKEKIVDINQEQAFIKGQIEAKKEQLAEVNNNISSFEQQVRDFPLAPRTVDEETLVPCTSGCQ